MAVACATVLFAARDYHAAFVTARDAGDPGGRGEATAFSIAERLGWFAEARALAEAAADRGGPGEARWRARLLALTSRWGDLPAAARHGARAVALAPTAASVWLELGRALAGSGDRERGLACAERGARLGGPLAKLEAASVALVAGDAAGAERHLRAALAHGDEPTALCALARLASFRGDRDAAAELCRRALALAPESPGVTRVLGALALEAGSLDDAERLLGEAAARAPGDTEARLLLVEAALARGDVALATARIPGNFGSREGPPHAASLVRAAVHLAAGEPLGESFRRELLPLLAEVCPEIEGLAGGDEEAWRRAVALSRERLRCNRSPTLFHLRGGALVPAGPRGTARHDARMVLESIRVVAPDEALARLRAVEAAYPRSSLPACHEGELLLWLGRLPEARAALERTLRIHFATRWAYIGLTLLECLEGQPIRGLAVAQRGVEVMRSEGPAVAAYRGEALRQLGRIDEALVDLEGAAARHPDRIAVWPSLGLARLAGGAGGAGHAGGLAVVRELEARAPGLAHDAARAAGLGDARVEGPGEARALFEAALRLLGGNRSSSCVTYHSPEGALRTVGRGGPGPHASDREDLSRAAEDLA